jgi:hypothetical protein
MQYRGWAARNLDEAPVLRMQRLSDYPERADWASAGTLKRLGKLEYETFAWVRTSPDGRYVAGARCFRKEEEPNKCRWARKPGEKGVFVRDLRQQDDILVGASYDPAFFPDNSGFVVKNVAGHEVDSLGTCLTRALWDNTTLDVDEAESCTLLGGVSDYQQVGAGLEGDYFVVSGKWTNDTGGGYIDRTHRTQENPSTRFQNGQSATAVRMTRNEGVYTASESYALDIPDSEGDISLSASTKLLATRTGPLRQEGYKIYRLVDEGEDVHVDRVGYIPGRGGVGQFSYDERFFTYHSYTAGLKADVYIVDLCTGEKVRVTDVPPDHYAVFPNFRADGWVYFVVKDEQGRQEWIAASNAARTGFPPTEQACEEQTP